MARLVRGTLILALVLAAAPAFASETNGTIVSGGNEGFAWSNQIGWVNFAATNGNVAISDSGITGYAWSANYGWINLAPANGGVAISASGALSGSAWGSSLGWINFSGVSINSSGRFTGQATGSIVGTLTFDCDNCSVTTDYRPQNVRSTPPPSGGGGGGGSTLSAPVADIPAPTPTPFGAQAADAQEGALIAGDPSEDARATGAFAQGVTETSPPGNPIPAQLFDITLEIDSPLVESAEDIGARLTFTSFGRVPTPVSIGIEVLDRAGAVVYRSDGSITVETEGVFRVSLGEAALPPGSYTLRATTLYNTDVRDEFSTAFEIVAPETASLWWPYLLFALLVLFALYGLARRKKEDAR